MGRISIVVEYVGAGLRVAAGVNLLCIRYAVRQVGMIEMYRY
jgi:hypothetical protein